MNQNIFNVVKGIAILATTSTLIYLILQEEKRKQRYYDSELNKALNMEVNVDENIKTVEAWRRQYEAHVGLLKPGEEGIPFKRFIDQMGLKKDYLKAWEKQAKGG